eukprot:m.115942 g.115942  ORF g.115942 m.115942 type:complete len:686 (-) comp28468_c0_seq1:64-2121(-)
MADSKWKDVISLDSMSLGKTDLLCALDKFNSTGANLASVDLIESLSNETAIVTFKNACSDNSVQVAVLVTGVSQTVELALYPVEGLPFSVPPTSMCTYGTDAVVLMESDNQVWKVKLGSPDSQKVQATATKLVEIPSAAIETCVTCCNGSVTIATLENRHPKIDVAAPILVPPVPRPNTLSVYTQQDGWQTVCTMPLNANGITIDTLGTRCAFAVMVNHIPEEAERGDYFVVDLKPNQTPRPATVGAGRVVDGGGGCLLSNDGTHLLYTANYSANRPITTCCDLWWLNLAGDDAKPVQITQDKTVERFGFVAQGARVWTTWVDKSERKSAIITLHDHAISETDIRVITPPICSDVAEVGGAPSTAAMLMFASENTNNFAKLFATTLDTNSVQTLASASIPHDEKLLDTYSELEVVVVDWVSNDGFNMTGAVYQKKGLDASASLLVHVHGGPAIAWPCDRSAATNSTRYPYRNLLLSGYRVFSPHYRGTLGFGNKFAIANFQCQGDAEKGDLADILEGVDALIAKEMVSPTAKLGIWGGSYGGYMTVRAMAVTNRFCAGVAQYGFIMNRWMSYEGGDFTFEDEYFGNREQWPVPEAQLRADTFEKLEQITSPVLLMHGKDDDICPLSQSFPVYNSLSTRKIPTGLIVYPGEGHGFDIAANKEDSCRRTLAWFLNFIPPTPSQSSSP